jgi:hypothetical protein
MTTFEKLLSLADEETLRLARDMIGKPELALLLAKAAVQHTTKEDLSPTKVAEAIGLTDKGARNRIFNSAVREPSKQ